MPNLPKTAEGRYIGVHTGEVCLVGPANTGKTRAVLEWLHRQCLDHPGTRVLLAKAFRDQHTQSTMVTLRNEVFPPDTLGTANSDKPIRWHDRQQAYLYQNGSEMVVKGLRDDSGLYSQQYDHVFVNEAGSPHIHEDDYDQLKRAKRNRRTVVSLLITDLNPEYEMHWLHLRCDEGFTVEVRTTHRDNPVVTAAELHDLETIRDTDVRKRLYLGLRVTAVAGAYYQDQLADARQQGRIKQVNHQPGLPVHVSFDLGWSDNVAMWFMQRVMGEWRWIDYYESNFEDLNHYAALMSSLAIECKYVYGTIVLPHDAKQETLAGAGKSIQRQFWELGLRNEVIVPNTPENVQRDTVRNIIPVSYFDNSRWVQPESHHRHRRGVKFGLQRLLTFRARKDERLGTYTNRYEHDLASHGGKSFAYMCLANPGNTLKTGQQQRRDVDYLGGGEYATLPGGEYRREGEKSGRRDEEAWD